MSYLSFQHKHLKGVSFLAPLGLLLLVVGVLNNSASAAPDVPIHERSTRFGVGYEYRMRQLDHDTDAIDTQRLERPEGGFRAERPERSESPGLDLPERLDKLDRPEFADRPDKPERPERSDRPDRVERPERVERPDRYERPERPERR